MAAKSPTVTRVRIAPEELGKMTKDQLLKCWHLQDQYVDLMESRLSSNTDHNELINLRENEDKLKQQHLEASRRENILVMRLTTKEHEMQEFAGQIQELKQAQIPSVAQLRSSMLDPAVNLLFDRMRKEVESLKAKLEETQNELQAWKFTPDSNTGKRLMAKCRLLYQENEELGKVISSGRMAKLEGDLALQKTFSDEMKKSQSELDEFLLELDEDVEGMQSTIYYLQQQLREAKEQIAHLQKEKSELPNGLPENHTVEVSTTKSLPQQTVETIEPITRNSIETPPARNFIETSPARNLIETPPARNSIETPPARNLIETPPARNLIETPPARNLIETTPPKVNREPELSKGLNGSIVKMEVDEPKEKAESDIKPTVSELDLSVQKYSKEHATPTEVIVQSSVIVENKVSSVIVENKNSVVPLVERTNSLILDSNDLMLLPENKSSPPPSTEERTVDDTEAKDLTKSKRTAIEVPVPPAVARGRKRTRPRTPVEEIKEENLPVRKRTRRREAAMLRESIVEDKQPSAVEIDAATEVQVAQTLASWASTKKDLRTELKAGLNNGEAIKEEPEDK